jgi:hypothetical protein
MGFKMMPYKTLVSETTGDRPDWAKGKRNHPRVGIAVSTFGAMPTAFVRSLAAVMRYSMFKGIVCDLVIDETKPLDDSRNSTVRELMATPNLDYIFFMDSDMIFDKATLVELIKQDKDIITGVFFQKAPPHNPVLRMYQEQTKRYEPIWTYPEGQIFTVDACGAGCLLVKADVFKKLTKPYFKWDAENKMSEDIYFCKKAVDAGYKIHVHGGWTCGHSADLHFIGADHYKAYVAALDNKLRLTDKAPARGSGVVKMDNSDRTQIESVKE